VFTDHKPLEWLMNLKKPNSRLLRWSLELQQYDIAIGYKPGVNHQNADCLSRIPINVINNVTSEWRLAQRRDPFCRAALQSFFRINLGDNRNLDDLLPPTSDEESLTNSNSPELRGSPPSNNRYKKNKYILLTGNLIGTKKGKF